MSLLFRVIYAVHARGTHHKLALDALSRLEGADADGWRRLFLKHAAVYLQGSKAPDDEFKDFKNHVLHVNDGYWGGATATARVWYDRLVGELRRQDWAAAVHSAGVLSHYHVDPIHPFHTGQSDAETNIHRAVEWSISKSYDSLKRDHGGSAARPQTAQGGDWLEQLGRQGADLANRSYHTLLVHYDFHKGVVEPEAGLDQHARRAVAELIDYASASYAVVLGRAIAEAGVQPPHVSLALDTVLAALGLPRQWLLKRLADQADRRQVEAMYDELQATGKVDAALSEDDRMMRDLHAAEVARGRGARPAAAVQPAPAQAPASAPIVSAAPAAKPAQPSMPSVPSIPAVATAPSRPEAPIRGHEPRLKGSDPVAAAPSIGDKTAERLGRIGVATVGDLLAADPETLANHVATPHINAGVIRAWQDQARLAATLPDLSGTKAQLLAAAGYRTAEAIAGADPRAIGEAMTKLAQTELGERILRGGTLPAATEIAGWVEAARALAAKAA